MRKKGIIRFWLEEVPPVKVGLLLIYTGFGVGSKENNP
jgi:hypothetical protein